MEIETQNCAEFLKEVSSLKLVQETRLVQYEVGIHEYFRQQQLLNVTLGHYVDETDACSTGPARVLWLEQWKSTVWGFRKSISCRINFNTLLLS